MRGRAPIAPMRRLAETVGTRQTALNTVRPQANLQKKSGPIGSCRGGQARGQWPEPWPLELLHALILPQKAVAAVGVACGRQCRVACTAPHFEIPGEGFRQYRSSPKFGQCHDDGRRSYRGLRGTSSAACFGFRAVSTAPCYFAPSLGKTAVWPAFWSTRSSVRARSWRGGRERRTAISRRSIQFH